MVQYILKKFLYGVIVLFGVVTTIFFLFNILPGDPANIMLGQRASKDAIAAVHRDLGTDRPLLEQYLHYLNDLSPLSMHTVNDQSLWYLDHQKYDWVPFMELNAHRVMVIKIPYLRRSYISKRDVSEIIKHTLPETTVLAFSAIIMASVIGILLGIVTATHKDSLLDRGIFICAPV